MDKIKLNQDWILSNKEFKVHVKTEIPSTVFEALQINDIIQDPFYGLNEHQVKWVFQTDWEYKTSFSVKNHVLNYQNIILCFYGLDTISKIYFNGTFIGNTNNMFRKYEFNIKELIKQEKNELVIILKSPVNYIKKQVDNYKINLNTGEMSISGSPYIRKAPYSFGWDWGPKLPDMGIWKDIEIIAYESIRIKSVYTYSEFHYLSYSNEDSKKDNYKKSSKNYNELNYNVDLHININLEGKIQNFCEDTHQVVIELQNPEGVKIIKKLDIKNSKIHIKIILENPILWWTHDLGEPNLYKLKIKILFNNEIIQIEEIYIGIRDLRLIRNKDGWGESFYFKLNRIPIFAKGANWIPIDSFIPRGSKNDFYNRTLKYAKMANMNMIRVWGGGVYESDAFYNICDKIGILVWQDFIFACGIYPIHNDYMQNLNLEVIQNVIRLRNHPSLALWCGNNEIEYLWKILLWQCGIKNEKIQERYKKGYLEIFEKIIPSLINKYDPNRFYWPSSPSNGFVGNNLGRTNANLPTKGDSHYWSVWHGGKSFKSYKSFKSRFISEFGFESFPSIKTISDFCSPEQLDLNSPMMENHQKNNAGNDKILKYMKKRFIIPESFEDQVILSQITQAEAIIYGIKYWRKNRINNQCMGNLYWQLNDCWPVASWSSIDYFGRWKALHYCIKRVYQPIIVVMEKKGENIQLWTVNDHIDQKEVIINWDIFNSNWEKKLTNSIDQIIPPLNSILTEKINILDLKKVNEYNKNHILYFEVINKEDNKVLFKDFSLFCNPKDFTLNDPKLQHKIEVQEQSSKNGLIRLNLNVFSKGIGIFVFIKSLKVDFISSDNFFSMKPNENRHITITVQNSEELKNKFSIKEVIDSFKIQSLYDLMK